MSPPLKVLIVDDSDLVLQAASAALSSAGYTVATHLGPLSTLVTVMSERPNIVLLDLDMNNSGARHGEYMAKCILSATSLKPRPLVILYSSAPREKLEESAKRCGAAFLEKGPVSALPQQLRAIIGSAVKP